MLSSLFGGGERKYEKGAKALENIILATDSYKVFARRRAALFSSSRWCAHAQLTFMRLESRAPRCR